MEDSITMTVEEVTNRMREVGISTSTPKVRAMLMQGKYPFGIGVQMKHQEFEIYRPLFEEWLDKVTGRQAV